MSEIILYPTETVYALGVNPLDEAAWQALCELKERAVTQSASWLVRSKADIAKYAEVNDEAERLIDAYLPGPLTIVLPAKPQLQNAAIQPDGTIGFRISSDPVAQSLINEYMATYDAPLTCTSANVHGQPTLPTPAEILKQFDDKQKHITRVVDDGPRTGVASTVVKVSEGKVEILRQGSVYLQG